MKARRYEFYYYFNSYNQEEKLDVKGISDDKLTLHKDYMIDFLFNIFKMFEVSPHSRIIKELIDFSYYYKRRDLEIGYYRELNSDSLFHLYTKFNKDMIGIQYTDDIKNVDISFNYLRYIVPLIKITI